MTAPEFGKWLPIETCPMDELVFVRAGEGWPTSSIQVEELVFKDEHNQLWANDIWPLTHWMPIPPATEVKQ